MLLMNIAFAALIFVFGTVIGSFLNVVILRTPLKEQIVKGRSHCMTCGHTLSWVDLFPVLSWVFLRGKCRYCGARISPRYAFVETLCGLSYLAAFLTLGLSVKLLFAIILSPVLICLSFFDIDTGEIEYWCPITIAALGLIALGLTLAKVNIAGMTGMPWFHRLFGAAIVGVPFAVLCVFGAMGGGDVQLMTAAGLLLGLNILPAELISIILGAVFGVIQKVKSQDSVLRFGPCLAIGIFTAFIAGEKIVAWYLNILG